MKQQALRQPVGTNFFYGWMIVMVGAMGLFFSGPGQTYGVSVFVDSYINSFNWSRSLVSGIYSAATLLSGMILFTAGRWVDKVGHRKMAVIVGLMLGVSCLWNSFISGPIMLFIGFFMIRFFGQGSMTLVSNTLVPQWFIAKRGRAMSFLAIGGFLSSAIFPPLNLWLIETFGWQTAWQFLAVFLWVVFVPMAFFLIRNKPEDVGLQPDGNGGPASKEKQSQAQVVDTPEENWTVKEAMKTRAFWCILFCVSIPALINTGITFHITSLFTEQGMSDGIAAMTLSIMAAIGFPVSMVAGFVLERVQVHKIIAVSFIGQLGFLVLLIFVDQIFIAILFGVLWGLVNGIERITLNIVWPNYFGRKHLGSIRGVAQTTMVLGSAFGPLPFGIAFDYFNSYTQILMVMMIFPILGLIAAFISPPPRKSDYIDDKKSRPSA